MFMNKYRIGILFIIAAVILGVVITITSTINEIDLDNIEEYGTMEVYETALKVNSSTVSSALNETENKNETKINKRHMLRKRNRNNENNRLTKTIYENS